MDRHELKKFIADKKSKIYEHPAYNDLHIFPLYNPSYNKKNPMKYIYLHSRNGNQLQPVRISKSIAIFQENDILNKMQKVAQKLDYLVIPVECLHWRRAKNLKVRFPHFTASINSYIMLPEDELNKNERMKLIDYLRNLEWHDDIIKNYSETN